LLPPFPLSISLPQNYDSQPQKLLFLNCKLFQLQYKDSGSKVDRPIRTSYEMNKKMVGGGIVYTLNKYKIIFEFTFTKKSVHKHE
jgi:hypothetical protein